MHRARASRMATCLIAAMWSCGGEPVRAAPVVAVVPATEPPPLVVEFAGCEGGERRANTCVRTGAAPLSAWIEGAPAQFFADDVALEPTRTDAVDGGHRVVLPIPAGARRLRAERVGAAAWTLALVDAPATPVLDRIRATLPDPNAAGRTPMLERALAEIDRALPTMAEYERVAALRLAMVLAWDAGRDPVALGRDAMAAALVLDDPTVILSCANPLIYMLAGDPEANLVLDVASMYAPNVADAVHRLRWHQDLAEQAMGQGRVGDALDALEASESVAQRLGLPADEAGAAGRRVAYLGQYGRAQERDAAIDRLLAITTAGDGRISCDEAPALINVTTSLVFAGGAADTVAAGESVLERVVQAFSSPENGCAPGDNPDLQLAEQVAHGNLVLGAIVRERWDQVAERLGWFDGRSIADALAPSVALFRAELAFARGDLPGARKRLASIGAESADPRIRWRIAVLQGRIEQAAGRRGAALAAFVRAEGVLDAMLEGVGVDQGREGVGVDMHDGASHAIALLIEQGRLAEAAQVARRSRVRALRRVGATGQLAQIGAADRAAWATAIGRYQAIRDRIATELTAAWELPTDQRTAMRRAHVELRAEMREAHSLAFEILGKASPAEDSFAPPPAGETWLLYHPAPQGWFAMALTPRGAQVHALRELPPSTDAAALGAALLEPFATAIGGAQHVRVLAMGPLLDVAFHELPFDGGVLIDRVPVTWALDVAAPQSAAKRQGALVVADPETLGAGVGRLQRSREEGESVAAALRGRGAVTLLAGADATALAVLALLPQVEWFHYAGHGSSAGTHGWDSALALAGEGQLAVRDVLAAPGVPRGVVLSGCATAAVVPGTAAGGVSLSTAFVLAGSEFVIGLAGDVADSDAAEIAAVLYSGAPVLDGAQLFRTAVLAGRARDRAWTRTLRVWVR